VPLGKPVVEPARDDGTPAVTLSPVEMSFLAPPDLVLDWRRVLLYDAAVEAGLLASLPASVSEVAERSSLDAGAVRVVLEALSIWDIVQARDDGRYVEGAGCPTGEEGAVLRHHARAIRRWSADIGNRLQGEPLSSGQAAGGPPRLDVFLGALAATSRQSAASIVDACLARMPKARTVLDLGGLHGEYALEFASRGLHATVQDRPAVIEALRGDDRLPRAGIDLFGGDFFETLPDTSFDIVFCAGVTHTYDAEHNLELFRRLRGIVTPAGALVIVTMLGGSGPVAALFAVQMLVGANGGDTHGEEDYRRWLADAGYSSVEVLDLDRSRHSVLLALP
jgi:hypothetical protein